MKRQRTFLLLAILCSSSCFAQIAYERYFEKKSLRIDFALSGNAQSQSAAIVQMREEPVWSGPVRNLIDPFNYGGYYVNVYDKESHTQIYSRGFNTLFEEWRTTNEAKAETQSWTNSVSIPYPKKEVLVEITGRERDDMRFYPLLTQLVDPASIYIDRSTLTKNHVVQIQSKGEASNKIDLVFLAEGYTESEQGKFEADAKRFTEALFGKSPFNKHRDAFNVRGVRLVSEESGTDVSGKGIFRNTALNSGYYTFGVDRYLTTPDMKSIRDAVWDVPCDALFILVNADTYGGGGMYNLYAIGTADHKRTVEVFVHELGHSFAGLADEYFSSEVAYNDFYSLKHEPWEPNITTLVDFKAKWHDLLPAHTPIPTPWTEKEAGSHKLGVFEGAGYLSKGMYRPQVNCLMRSADDFCPVCERAVLRMIRYLSDQSE